MLKQCYAVNDKKNQLEAQITKINEKNIALTETMLQLKTFSKTTIGNLQTVKKKLEDFKDDFCQPQIPSCSSKILKRDNEDLKLRMHEMSKSIADLDLRLQLQENKTADFNAN